MIFIYRLFLIIILIFGAPFLLVKALIGGHGVKERLGFINPNDSAGRMFWFHAASLGELKILALVIPLIREKNDDIGFAVSTTTMTGKLMAQKLFGDFAQVFLQPLELKSSVKRTLDSIKPEKLIMVETELWPLLITEAHKAGVNISLINGRMSEKSFRLYAIFRFLFSPVIRNFKNIVARTQADAERFSALGAENIFIVGNVKYDQVFNRFETRPPRIETGNDLIFVAGSLRKGEGAIIIDTISESFENKLPIRFIIVPRHMKDVTGLTERLRMSLIKYCLWSELEKNELPDNTVLVVDTMGELPDFYQISDIAFVGGSLVPIGGHDPVEPASFGKMVLFGPYMENASEAAEALLESGGAIEVTNSDDIFVFIQKALEDKDMLIENGEKCKNAVMSLAGASKKTVEILMR